MPSRSATPTELTALLGELIATGVEFILVGGLAAVAQGAPITTFDIDVVPLRSTANVDALMSFLASVHAYHRGRPRGERLPPSRDALLGKGHSLLMTDLGPLDVLGAIEGGRDYQGLLSHTVEVTVGGRSVKVLGLEALVELKRGSTHNKDRLVLPILEETLRRVRAR